MTYAIEVAPGTALRKDALETCVSVIREGCAVDASSAAKQLPKAKSVATVRANGQIVGVGAVKNSRPDYASDIAKKSGFPFDSNMLELGYVTRSPSHRGHRLSEQIVGKLIEAVKGVPLFATTSHETMKGTLSNAGFVQQGHAWTGRNKNEISLWVKQAG